MWYVLTTNSTASCSETCAALALKRMQTSWFSLFLATAYVSNGFCPVKKVTSVMFGGENLDVLYVTSMAQPPLPRFPEDNQLRGSLFAIYDLGVTGVAERRFAG